MNVLGLFIQRVAVLHLEDRCRRALEWARKIDPSVACLVTPFYLLLRTFCQSLDSHNSEEEVFHILQTCGTKRESISPSPSAGCIRGRGFQSTSSQQTELHHPGSWTSPCLPTSSPVHRQWYLLTSSLVCKIFVNSLPLAQ